LIEASITIPQVAFLIAHCRHDSGR